MQLTTPVEMGKERLNISHRSRILLLGSCFAQNIGQKLLDYKFDVCNNPFGIIYNPQSIATVLNRIIGGEPFHALSPEIVEHGERWHSLLHHGCFSARTKNELIENINGSLARAHRQIKHADVVIITLGTAYAYERKSDKFVVSNCHKLPASTFDRRLLSTEEITEKMGETIRRITKQNPDVKILLTVSPIRHLRDGAHDNQLSKATLLLATERLREAFPRNVIYFPAYEIMMDELRDYRFYAEDMAHPSPIAVEYIWEKFREQHLDKESISLGAAIEEIKRGLEHRPFDATATAYKKFIENILLKIRSITEKHPYLDFEKETEQCNTQLNR